MLQYLGSVGGKRNFVHGPAISSHHKKQMTMLSIIAGFAPSNVSYTWEDAILGHEIFASIFERGNRILGVITTEAKIGAYEQGASRSVLQMFTLFGDPAVSLKAW